MILGETPAGEPIRLLNESVLNGTIFDDSGHLHDGIFLGAERGA